MHVHPKRTRARVLLTSVFGPYARDDEFGSRSMNPMELYHNQVTRAQGPFSLRMFHRSWGPMMIQHNISAPCTVFDFPTREQFISELQAERYDVVGISSIIVNVGKVREMCRLVRQLCPWATILVGGHVTAIPGLEDMVDADHIVRGEGIRWMRAFLGEDPSQPIAHPPIRSGLNARIMGIKIPAIFDAPAATIIPSVGCPMGCNFCTTSAFFGGKGKFTNFFETGAELYRIMCGVERELNVRSFFVMDENFLLNQPRTLDLLSHLERGGKSWELFVFSSVNAIRKYSMEQLVRLGVSWVWMGLESPRSSYTKLRDADTVALAKEMRSHGIKLLGSTIVGMEHHTPDTFACELDHAIRHETDFHQFMLYTPVPGTPLYRQMEREGRLLPVDLADIHGQWKFNFLHPAISRDESKRLLDWAFQCDFEVNGPSLYRIIHTTFRGWERHRRHEDERVRRRFAAEERSLRYIYPAALHAMEAHQANVNSRISRRIRALRLEIENTFGISSRLSSRLFGPVLSWTTRREERRLRRGVTYEPGVVIERRNWTSDRAVREPELVRECNCAETASVARQ
jgi:radical SAM superfamily enzyme YgiQ (UPF0313 family)